MDETSKALSKRAGRRLRLAVSLLAVCVSSALAAAAPATNGARPLPERSEARATAATPGTSLAPAAAREEPAHTTPSAESKLASPPASNNAGSSDMTRWLFAGCVTLGLAAIATAILLSRAQSRLDAETARREAIEKKYDHLYNRSPSGYHTLDAKGVVVEMNDTEIGWLGYRRDEIIGKKYAEFLAESSWSAFPEAYDHLLRGEPTDLVELRHQIVDRNGKARWLALTPSFVRDERGRIVATRWSAVDLSERIRLEQALESEAHFDRVTNAHNRLFFFTLGEREIARARRGGGRLALLYIDIDDFTRINTIYGNFGGDRVLKAVCGLIAAGLRNVDVFARVGDDEFAILLPDVGREGATVVAERLKKSVAETPVRLSSNDSIEVRIAVGVGEYSAATRNLDALLAEGERALEQAKHQTQAAERQTTELAAIDPAPAPASAAAT